MLLKRIAVWFYTGLIFLVVAPAAFADTVHTTPVLALQSKQVWTLVIGAFVPRATYALNHAAPWVSEPAKAFATVLVAAVSGGLYTALSTSSFGANTATLEMVLTSVVAALGAHQWLWKPSTVAARLGGGSNATSGHRRLRWVSDPPAEDPPPTT